MRRTMRIPILVVPPGSLAQTLRTGARRVRGRRRAARRLTEHVVLVDEARVAGAQVARHDPREVADADRVFPPRVRGGRVHVRAPSELTHVVQTEELPCAAQGGEHGGQGHLAVHAVVHSAAAHLRPNTLSTLRGANLIQGGRVRSPRDARPRARRFVFLRSGNFFFVCTTSPLVQDVQLGRLGVRRAPSVAQGVDKRWGL